MGRWISHPQDLRADEILFDNKPLLPDTAQPLWLTCTAEDFAESKAERLAIREAYRRRKYAAREVV